MVGSSPSRSHQDSAAEPLNIVPLAFARFLVPIVDLKRCTTGSPPSDLTLPHPRLKFNRASRLPLQPLPSELSHAGGCTNFPSGESTTHSDCLRQANLFLEECFANQSSDWWRMTFGTGQQFSGPPLENAYSVAVFAMFHSRSRWVQAGEVAPLSARAEQGMLAFWFRFAESCAKFYPNEAFGAPLRLHDSENIDSVRHTGCFLGSQTLALHPDYANRTLPDGRTISETAVAWEAFTYSWLKLKALNGFFSELGSSGYWTRTWPCLWALHTLSPVGSRVEQRAKMFIDLAMLEAELASIAGVRAGQKSRDKKAQCPTCSSKGPNPALEHHMYTAQTPQLYGDDLNGPVASLYTAPISTQHLGGYQMGNVSILVHHFGVAPDTAGVYTMRNRALGQVPGTANDMETCSEERCAETFRPYPCACDGGGGNWTALVSPPRQVHVVSRTPEYSLAGVVFSPNDAFVANCQQRGTGLVFSNPEHSAVVLPHLTGEKWGLVEQDLMLVQRCGSCNYGGASLFQIFNATKVWSTGPWWFMAAGPKGDGGAVGWAAMRAAWGGTNFTNSTLPTSPLLQGNVVLNDTWSPLILIAGGASEYATVENFSRAVLAATLEVNALAKTLTFGWKGRSFGFTAGPSAWKGKWTLPTVDGVPVDIDPPFIYSSPHMSTQIGSEVVTAQYRDYSLLYNFTDDTIRRNTPK